MVKLANQYAYNESAYGSPYAVNIYAIPLNSITFSGNGIYDYGDEVTVIAIEEENYHFSHWEIDGKYVSHNKEYTFILTKDTDIYAVSILKLPISSLLSMIRNNQFLVSVADLILRDRKTDQIVLKGKTLMESVINQNVSTGKITGGKTNKLLFKYNHTKEWEINIKDAVWRESYIAINNGVGVKNKLKNSYIFNEIVELDVNGQGFLENIPVGNIYVELPTGSIKTTIPSGKNFVIHGLSNKRVMVTYRHSESVDFIKINADATMKSYEMVMFIDLFTPQEKIAIVEIVIPNFKPTGEFTIDLNSNGVSSGLIKGSALLDEDNDSYGDVYIKPATYKVALADIYCNFSLLELDLNSFETERILTYGVRGGVYDDVNIDASLLTFTSDDMSVAIVNTTGLIIPIDVGTATITVKHNDVDLETYITVNVV